MTTNKKKAVSDLRGCGRSSSARKVEILIAAYLVSPSERWYGNRVKVRTQQYLHNFP